MKRIIGFFVLSLLMTVCYAQKTALGLNLEIGATYKQVNRSSVSIHQTVQGHDMKMNMAVEANMSYLVRSVVSDVYEFDVQYTKLGMMVESPQGEMIFDSEKKEGTDVLSNLLSTMVRKVFQVKMAKNGKVLEVKNVESVIESAFDVVTGLSELQKTQLKAQLTNAYGAEAFKGNIESGTAVFPDGKVDVGDAWTVVTHMESGMASVMTAEYTLAELNDAFVLLQGNATVQTADKDAYVESNGMPMRYDLNGTVTSAIKLDRTTGWVIESRITQDMKGRADIKANDQLPEGLTIPMVIHSESVIRNL